MATRDQLPLPSSETEGGALGLTDPHTGKPLSVGDMRAEFQRLSRAVPRDVEAERAFIASKIEMIRNDPNLSAAEKERAIAELRPCGQ